MKFKVVTLSVMAALAMNADAGGLTLGTPEVSFSVGEPLFVKVPLHASSGGVKAKLIRDLDVYARLDIPWLEDWRDARVRLVREAGGRYVLIVRTRKPFWHPVIDFPIEITWKDGRIVREIVAFPAVGRRATEKGTESRPPEAALKTGYRVRPGDTLLGISRRLIRKTGAGVRTEQMAVALYKRNPKAFIGGDMHRLKAGAVLDVPSIEAVRAIDPVAARRAISESWRARLAKRTGVLRLTAESETKAPKTNAEQTEPNRPVTDKKKNVDQILATRLAESERKLATLRRMNAALSEKARKLEAALAETTAEKEAATRALVQAREMSEQAERRIAELESRLAALTARAADGRTSPKKEAGSNTRQEASTNPPESTQTTPKPEKTAIASGSSRTSVAVERTLQKTDDNTERTGFEHMYWYAALTSVALALFITAVKIWRRHRAMRSVESLLERGDKHIESEGGDPASNAQKEDAHIDFGIQIDDVAEVEDIDFDDILSFDPNATVKDDEFDVKVLDPITEAETYLIYQDFDKAETCLLNAIKADPERQQLYLKLAECHYLRCQSDPCEENRQKFLEYVRRLREGAFGKFNEVFWKQIEEYVQDVEAPTGEKVGGETARQTESETDAEPPEHDAVPTRKDAEEGGDRASEVSEANTETIHALEDDSTALSGKAKEHVAILQAYMEKEDFENAKRFAMQILESDPDPDTSRVINRILNAIDKRTVG